MPNTKPFEAEPAVVPTDPIVEGAATVRQRFAEKKAQHKADALAAAESAWQESEAKRRKRFIRDWLADNYVPLEDPYKDMSDLELFQLSLPKERRIEGLLDQKLYPQALACWMRSRKNVADLKNVKDLLRPYIPVDGTVSIVTRTEAALRHPADAEPPRVHATGLSEDLRWTIRNAGYTVRNGDVVPNEGDEPWAIEDRN